MQSHEEIMEIHRLLTEELERKEKFRKSMRASIQEYEFSKVAMTIEIEEKTDILLRDSLSDAATKSMRKTEFYKFLEQGNIEELIRIAESKDFKYHLHYVDLYNNALKDVVSKFWKPTSIVEQLMSALIEHAVSFSIEKSEKTLESIKDWHQNWMPFMEKQILYYKLCKERDSMNPLDVKIGELVKL